MNTLQGLPDGVRAGAEASPPVSALRTAFLAVRLAGRVHRPEREG